jgi:hypothetical protein
VVRRIAFIVVSTGLRRLCVLLALWAGAQCVAPATAAVEGTWAAPVDLQPASWSHEADVELYGAFDAAGNAWAVWSTSDDAGRYRATVAELPAGNAAWQPSTVLSVAGQDAEGAQIAVDPRGDVLVVWILYDGFGSGIVQAAWRSAASGTWEPPVDLTPARQIMYEPALALDAAGNAIVAWTAPGDGSAVIQSATRSAATGAWGAPATLSAAGTAYTPQLAMNAAGDAVAQWWRNGVIEDAYRPAGTVTWEAPVALSSTTTLGGAMIPSDVAIDPAGNVVAVWSGADQDGASSYDMIQASRRSAMTGLWTPRTNLSVSNVLTSNLESTSPSVTFGAAGEAIVAWIHNADGPHYVQASVLPSGQSAWSPPVDVSLWDPTTFYPEFPSEPQVAADTRGNAVIIWRQVYAGVWHDIKTAWLPAGSQTWTAPLSHAAAADEYAETPDITFDAHGNALALWLRSGFPDHNVTGWVPVAATYDLAPRATPPTPPLEAVPSGVASVARAPAAAPRILRAVLTHRRFRDARSRRAPAQQPRGTAFRLTLSTAARVTIAVRREARGHHVTVRGCVAGSRPHTPRCTALVPAGKITRALVPAGMSSISFAGRLAGRTLDPGDYLATLTPSAKGVPGKSINLAFTVLP